MFFLYGAYQERTGKKSLARDKNDAMNKGC